MDQKQALAFIELQSRPENLGWGPLSKLIGERFPIVYGWYRRGSVPAWRLPVVEKAANKFSRVAKQSSSPKPKRKAAK